MKKGQIKKVIPKNSSSIKQNDYKKSYFSLFGLITVILLGIIIYSNSFDCSFHFDDASNIVKNTKIHKLADVNAWWNFYPTRPLALFTFTLNYHFNHLDVWGYHLVNLIIHLINACMVWWLTMLIFSSPALKGHKLIHHKKWIALATAFLFVSHPLATQSVTYIVQRMTSMAAMFYLISIVFYAMARLSDKGFTNRYLLYAGCIISGLMAMITKENAFTLPFSILLFEFFFLRKKKLKIDLKDYRLFLMMAGLIAVILIILLKFPLNILKPIPPTHGHTYSLTPANYLLTEFSVIVKYIQLLFLPINQMLDYDFHVSESFFSFKTFISFLLLIGLLILAIFQFKKHRVISFGIFWFFLTLAVESSIIPIEDVIFEHRTYLPSFGFFLVLSSTLFLLLWDKYKYIGIAVFSIIILSNSYLTYQRNKIWKNEFTLMNDNVEKAPGIARPLVNRGVEYSNKQQWDKALDDYNKAILINPQFGDAYYNRGVVYAHYEQWDKAITDYNKAISILPDYMMAYYNRGVAFGYIGKWNKAINDYNRAIQLYPDYTDAYHNRGFAYAQYKLWDKAISDYSKTIQIDSGYAKAYVSRGVTYAKILQWDKAIADFLSAIRINHNDSEAYFNLALAHGNLKQWDKAIANFTNVIAINPNMINAYYTRGLSYINLSQWDKAIADFSHVLELDPYNKMAFVQRDIAYKNLNNKKLP